ncbi:CpsD/CapB family tyrosine-protein kinase [Sporomusa ovata]|uniref:CpsD/CapB family tyrosine-protein kinase n=1 Tax=Sporomusa ovata TaxID=2378 RepID=UPI0003FC71D3|nr:CpsD/CapB family tyrosine-protein kinase [Sporomusa ovata]
MDKRSRMDGRSRKDRRSRKGGRPQGKQARYVISDREQSPFAESFRVLCASIRDAKPQGKVQTVLFTSANSGEGGAMVAVNSATLLAYAGYKVVLVDCDLRAPIVYDIFGLENTGLTNLIRDEVSQEDILQDSRISNLKVVTCGPLPLESVTVLSNPKIRVLLDYLRTQADYIFLTSSPILIKMDAVISDACVLASKVDGVVLVVDSRAVKPQNAKKVLELLLGAKANIIGTVLNDAIDY